MDAAIAAFIAPRLFEVTLAEIIAAFIIASCIPLCGTAYHPTSIRQRSWAIFGLVASFTIGLWLAFHPEKGSETIAVLLAAYFILHGIIKMIMSSQIESIPDRGLTIVAGSFSIMAGLIVGKFLEDITIQHTGIATGIALIFPRGHGFDPDFT